MWSAQHCLARCSAISCQVASCRLYCAVCCSSCRCSAVKPVLVQSAAADAVHANLECNAAVDLWHIVAGCLFARGSFFPEPLTWCGCTNCCLYAPISAASSSAAVAFSVGYMRLSAACFGISLCPSQFDWRPKHVTFPLTLD